jgi:hypothetical protein
VDILSMMGLEGCMAALGPDGSVLETHEGTFCWRLAWPAANRGRCVLGGVKTGQHHKVDGGRLQLPWFLAPRPCIFQQ